MAKAKADQDRLAIDFEAKIKTSRIDAEKSIAKANAEFATELQRAEAAKKLLESQILELQRGNELKRGSLRGKDKTTRSSSLIRTRSSISANPYTSGRRCSEDKCCRATRKQMYILLQNCNWPYRRPG